MTTLKYTWRKRTKYPIEVKLHIDEEKDTYWIEVNGCQETSEVSVPNVGLPDRGGAWWK